MKNRNTLIAAGLVFVLQIVIVGISIYGIVNMELGESLTEKYENLYAAIEKGRIDPEKKDLLVLLKQSHSQNDLLEEIVKSLLDGWRYLVNIMVVIAIFQGILFYGLIKYCRK